MSPWTSTVIEKIQIKALGGADTLTVNDLSEHRREGTVAIDLGGQHRNRRWCGGYRDRQRHRGGNNHITLTPSGTEVTVNGLSAQVTIDNAEAANDALVMTRP